MFVWLLFPPLLFPSLLSIVYSLNKISVLKNLSWLFSHAPSHEYALLVQVNDGKRFFSRLKFTANYGRTLFTSYIVHMEKTWLGISYSY